MGAEPTPSPPPDPHLDTCRICGSCKHRGHQSPLSLHCVEMATLAQVTWGHFNIVLSYAESNRLNFYVLFFCVPLLVHWNPTPNIHNISCGCQGSGRYIENGHVECAEWDYGIFSLYGVVTNTQNIIITSSALIIQTMRNIYFPWCHHNLCTQLQSGRQKSLQQEIRRRRNRCRR